MRTPDQILELLILLDRSVADELEDQDLDFKEWNTRSMDDSATRHTELETSLAAELCQRPEAAMRNTLSHMERDLGWLQRGGSGRGTYWTLSLPVARKIRPTGREQARIDWEAAKTRVLSILKQRARASEEGLSNSELRQITAFDRPQVKRLMRELREEHLGIHLIGERKAARYVLDLNLENPKNDP